MHGTNSQRNRWWAKYKHSLGTFWFPANANGTAMANSSRCEANAASMNQMVVSTRTGSECLSVRASFSCCTERRCLLPPRSTPCSSLMDGGIILVVDCFGYVLCGTNGKFGGWARPCGLHWLCARSVVIYVANCVLVANAISWMCGSIQHVKTQDLEYYLVTIIRMPTKTK